MSMLEILDEQQQVIDRLCEIVRRQAQTIAALKMTDEFRKK